MYVLTAQVAQTLYETSSEFTGECIKLLKYDLNYIKKINKNDSTYVRVLCFTIFSLLEPFGNRFIEF